VAAYLRNMIPSTSCPILTLKKRLYAALRPLPCSRTSAATSARPAAGRASRLQSCLALLTFLNEFCRFGDASMKECGETGGGGAEGNVEDDNDEAAE
jgi:hypothetical protein